MIVLEMLIKVSVFALVLEIFFISLLPFAIQLFILTLQLGIEVLKFVKLRFLTLQQIIQGVQLFGKSSNLLL